MQRDHIIIRVYEPPREARDVVQRGEDRVRVESWKLAVRVWEEGSMGHQRYSTSRLVEQESVSGVAGEWTGGVRTTPTGPRVAEAVVDERLERRLERSSGEET